MNVFRNCLTAALLSIFALSATILNAHAERGRYDTFTYKGRNYLCKRGLILWISPSGVPYCDKPAQRKPAPQPVATQPTQPQIQPAQSGGSTAPVGSTTIGFPWQYPDPVACVKQFAHSQNPLRGPVGKIIDRRIDTGKLRPVRQGIPTAYASVEAEMLAGVGELLQEIYKGIYAKTAGKLTVAGCSLLTPDMILPGVASECSSAESRAKYEAGVMRKCSEKPEGSPERSICYCLKNSTVHFMEQNCLAAARSPQVADYINRLIKWCAENSGGTFTNFKNNLTNLMPKLQGITTPSPETPGGNSSKQKNDPLQELPSGNEE